MQIEFDEHYSEVATYTGKVNGKYYFTVKVYWDSISKKYVPKVVDFSDDMSVSFDTDKAKKRIKSLVRGWYYEKYEKGYGDILDVQENGSDSGENENTQ